MSSYSYHIAILNENICFTGFKKFFFAHKKIKIFRVGGKNRVGRVTPIKQFFFLGLILHIYVDVWKKKKKKINEKYNWLIPTVTTCFKLLKNTVYLFPYFQNNFGKNEW